jgi:hypothetical protein
MRKPRKRVGRLWLFATWLQSGSLPEGLGHSVATAAGRERVLRFYSAGCVDRRIEEAFNKWAETKYAEPSPRLP